MRAVLSVNGGIFPNKFVCAREKKRGGGRETDRRICVRRSLALRIARVLYARRTEWAFSIVPRIIRNDYVVKIMHTWHDRRLYME